MNKFMMKIGIDELFVVDAVKKTGGLAGIQRNYRRKDFVY